MSPEIPKAKELCEKVFSINNDEDFREIALKAFHFQYYNIPVYRQYCEIIGRTPLNVRLPEEIPFLPISFFKTHEVRSGEENDQLIFRSSGTSGMETSRHFVQDPSIYEKSFRLGFEQFYGSVQGSCILGLLPSYLERKDSSLVYMVKDLIESSRHSNSGFYLYEHAKLASLLGQLEAEGSRTILIGVTYALLDFASSHPMKLHHSIIMETGGMKGKGKELVRSEVHDSIKNAFGLESVHSEYGMTELLSQAYSPDNGLFKTPSWMKVLIRDETDPLSSRASTGQPLSGAINVIDLANIYSCSFIATEDMGRLHPDGRFEVMGRLDNSDIRGCSLMTV
jgi:hypothetical protein